MKKLNDYFKNLAYTKFLTFGAIIIYISDIFNIIYINTHFIPLRINNNYIYNVVRLQGVNPAQLDPTYVSEMRMVIINTLVNVFYMFLVYHAFMYFMFKKDKPFAKKYVYGYAFTGAILTAIEIPFLAQRHIGWTIVMLFTTAIYVYMWYGLRFYKKHPHLMKIK
jgi:hypothetical protein